MNGMEVGQVKIEYANAGSVISDKQLEACFSSLIDHADISLDDNDLERIFYNALLTEDL